MRIELQNRNEKRRIRVVLVDSYTDSLYCTKDILNLQGGLDIETAVSSDEAIAKMKKMKPDVVVCDSRVSNVSCFELIKVLRDNGNTAPTIVFACEEEKEFAAKVNRVAANGFIEKNGDIPTVYSKLRKCIESVTGIQLNFKEPAA